MILSIRSTQLCRLFCWSPPSTEDRSSTLLGSKDGAASAGMTHFRKVRQYRASSFPDGREAFSISATNDGMEATVWRAELKKQVFPTFGSVWRKALLLVCLSTSYPDVRTSERWPAVIVDNALAGTSVSRDICSGSALYCVGTGRALVAGAIVRPLCLLSRYCSLAFSCPRAGNRWSIVSTHLQSAGSATSFWRLVQRSSLVVEEGGPHWLEQSNGRSACSAS